MQFSIIVPVYNSEKWLDDFFQSIYKQTIDKNQFELILINDGSTDQSLDIMNDWQRYFADRMTIYTQNNQGVSVARNKGIELARGEYILFIDPDDYVHPQLLQKLQAEIDQHPKVDMIRFQYQTFRDGKQSILTKLRDGIKKDTIHTGLVDYYTLSEFLNRVSSIGYIWCSCIRSSIIKQYQFVKDIIYEDVVFNSMILKDIHHISVIDQPLYFYRIHSTSLTSKTDIQSVETVLDILSNLKNTDYAFSSESEKEAYYQFLDRQIAMVTDLKIKSMDNRRLIQHCLEQNEYKTLMNQLIHRSIKTVYQKLNVE